jgi:hypothetical protein
VTKEQLRTGVCYFLVLIFGILIVGFGYQLGCLAHEGSVESCRKRWMPINVVEPVAVGLLLLLLVGIVRWTFRECIHKMWAD